MAEINNINSIAREIVSNLDKQDGKEDGKIEASIWNKFVCEKQGNEIHNYITTNSAIKSVVAYLKREVAKTGQAIEDVANEWLKNVGGGDKGEINPNDKTADKLSVKYPIINNLRFLDNDGIVENEQIKNKAQNITENATQLLLELAEKKYRYDIEITADYRKSNSHYQRRTASLKDGRSIEITLKERENGKYEIATIYICTNNKAELNDISISGHESHEGANLEIFDNKNTTRQDIDNETFQDYCKLIPKIFGDDIEV